MPKKTLKNALKKPRDTHFYRPTSIPLHSANTPFLARDVIYTSLAYAMMPVRLSVTEVHWRIIANLGFKF